MTVVRLQAHVGTTLQSAVMERLLALPASFFRRYEIGDLADRLMGIDRIEQYVSDITISAALSGVFSLVSFGCSSIYDAGLAWLCALLALIAIGAAVAEALATLPFRREIFDRYGQHRGFCSSDIQRHCQAAGRARGDARFCRLAAPLRRDAPHHDPRRHDRLPLWHLQCDLARSDDARDHRVHLPVRHGAFPASTFIAASAAFGQLLASLLGLAIAFVQVIRVIPIYERARPLLREMPEILEAHGDPGKLNGAIELRDLSFRYEAAASGNARPIGLEDRAGLLRRHRRAVGVGKVDACFVCFSASKNQAMVRYSTTATTSASVDLAAVRRQIGSVLQSTGALQGSIFENIAGARYITHDQAWDAARRVGIADDIAQLPMQLETYLGSDGGGLSTGQRQRIAIARAIVTCAAHPAL